MAPARLVVIAIAVAIVALLAVFELVSGGAGASLAERFFGTRDLSYRANAIDRAIDGSFVKLGITDVKGGREERESGRCTWPYWEKSGKIPHGVSLVECNLAITSAVRAAGGRAVKISERTPDWRGLGALDMRFGFSGRETHKVSLGESPRSEDTDGVAASGTGRRGDASDAPRIAIIIDDLGHNDSSVTRGLIELGVPITLAILPNRPETRSTAEAARVAGKEILLHIPMEPEAGTEVGPGEGALLASHSTREMQELVEQAIESVPHAVGVNNHMGSLLTRDRAAMRAVMGVLKTRGLFFVDSMTTPRSVAYAEAERAGLSMARNNMYLDSQFDQTGTVDVESQLEELESLARMRGQAIAIGHPRAETLDVLRARLPEMAKRGIEFVYVSELVR